MHACIIGAGVIGVTTAWSLARRGWDVTLVDAANAPAAVTSHANGGQLSYSYVAPLAGPGVLPHLPGWLFSRTSPLRFRPRLDPLQWHWCLQFLRACNAHTASASTARMLSLSYLSRDCLETLLTEIPIDFNHIRNGKLIIYRTGALLDKARRQVDYQASLGAEQRILTAAECIELEPALTPAQHAIAGAIYTPSEAAGDCARFTQSLFDALVAQGRVQSRLSTSIERLERSGGVIQTARTREGDTIRADQFIVAAGMGSLGLLRGLSDAPLLYPLKGYSLSVPCRPGQTPAINITDYERRTVYADLGGTLRIAAMVGIGVPGTQIEPDRIALLKRQVHELLPGLDLAHAQAWAGQRPATPHGLPLIGHSRTASNLWLNIGHGALGFTLACGSGDLLANLMTGTPPAIDPTPFQPDR